MRACRACSVSAAPDAPAAAAASANAPARLLLQLIGLLAPVVIEHQLHGKSFTEQVDQDLPPARRAGQRSLIPLPRRVEGGDVRSVDLEHDVPALQAAAVRVGV